MARPAAADVPLRIGVLGLGMAGGIMTNVIAHHPDTRVAGAADLNPELRERFHLDWGFEAEASALDLVRRDDLDAIYIATPHEFHREHAELAAAHGKHVVVEKPMALALADCDAMITAARANEVALIVGHTHGFDPAVERMRELIASGETGRPVQIAALNYTNFIYRPRRPEELDAARGGGILFNQVPHQVDMVRLLAGAAVRSVRAQAAMLDPERPVDGALSAFLTFENGCVATLVYSGYDRFDSDEWHDWIGESGNVKSPAHGRTRQALRDLGGAAAEQRSRWDRFGYGGQAYSSMAMPHQPHFGTLVVSCERADLRPSADGVLLYDVDGRRELPLPKTGDRPGHVAVLDELAAAARGLAAPVRDGAFARGTLAVCLAMRRSAQEGCEVSLKDP